MNTNTKYDVVIGLEVHAQLLTKSKAFCADVADFGDLPNTNISAITIAHPGAMPKLNIKSIEFAVKMGLACKSEITRDSFFDRKNYFYPDLPKGYQTTQDKEPICRGGSVKIKLKDGTVKHINLTKIHMEEDAGKSMHLAEETNTLVDLNRAGVPLIEIVSEPEMYTSEEAYQYLTEVRKLVRYLEICDGNMEEGSLRCDANISIKPAGATELGKKVEVKNMNSIRNVQRAIDHEVERQIVMADLGINIPSETRTFDATDGKTYSLRTKEDLNDYRYFPEPDLQPFHVSEKWLQDIAQTLPQLPNELIEKFTAKYKIPEYDAQVLTDTKEIALYFDDLCSKTQYYKTASNLVMSNVKSYLNDAAISIQDFPISTQNLAQLIEMIETNLVSHTAATQKIFGKMIENVGVNPKQIAEQMNLIQESNVGLLDEMVMQVLAKFPAKIEEYKKGKTGLMGLFVGEVMKISGGKADPKVLNEILKQKLEA